MSNEFGCVNWFGLLCHSCGADFSGALGLCGEWSCVFSTRSQELRPRFLAQHPFGHSG
jgi:hypothetical protein